MTKEELLKELERIKKNSQFQSYGWKELDNDLDYLIAVLKEKVSKT